MDEFLIENKLSKKEKAIIQLITQGKCRKNIADELHSSVHTIDTHLRHIHLKTRTHSLTQLIVWAMHNQELFPPTH
jgi:LuxR family transcriptional regulator, maltose regulon positive regulatory protein